MPGVDSPLVSVIIPAIRDDEFLRVAVDSVQSDGYGNLEVIVVWDAKDGSKPAERTDVRYVYTGGVGTPGANNAGLDAARGDFIARIDADDISYPGRFEAQVRALTANPNSVLCVTWGTVVDEHAAIVDTYPDVHTEDLPGVLLSRSRLLHSTFMFRKSKFRYDLRCVRMQDYKIALDIARLSPIVVVPERYVGYRVHGSQTGRQTNLFWQYIPVVLSGRRSLAKNLAESHLRQELRNIAWFLVQYANHIGLRDRYASLSARRRSMLRVSSELDNGAGR